MDHKTQTLLSLERLGKYLSSSRGDLRRAIELYEINLRVSQGLHGVLHGHEITVRNAMDAQLRLHYQRIDWYEVAPLSPWHTREIAKAKDKCRTGAATPRRVISELTLGFWTGLAARAYETSVWVPCLRKVFKGGMSTRANAHKSLQNIQNLRTPGPAVSSILSVSTPRVRPRDTIPTRPVCSAASC